MISSTGIKTLLVTLSALGLTACAAHSNTDVIASGSIDTVNEIMAPWMSDEAPGVVVAISLDDELVYAEGAGMADLENSIPLSPTSVGQVASVSKQVTAFATLLLVADGQIELDKDIRTYVPDFPETETPITVRHLLDHTSGLREHGTLAQMAGWLTDDIHTTAQMRALAKRQRGVNFVAGEEIEYSNTGYALLAEIIEHVSGQSFADFTRERIFDPLGMTQTSFPTGRHAVIPQRASSYFPDGDGFGRVVAASETVGSTGLRTTVLDLLKWAENFETRAVGDAMVFDLMAERFEARNGDASTFAKGQELREYKGYETWSHGGVDAGFRSFLLRVPDKDLEIAVISNRTDFDKAALAFELADAFLPGDNGQEDDWAAATPNDLSAYAGNYEVFPGLIFSLEAEQDSLTFAMYGAPDSERQKLPQIGPREFLLNESPLRSLIFETPIDSASPKVGYRLGMDGMLNANRIELASFDPEAVALSEFTGHCYSDELATSYKLEIVNGTLTAVHGRIPSFALTPYQTNTFMGAGPLQNLEFKRSPNGDLEGFYASASLAEGIWFECR